MGTNPTEPLLLAIGERIAQLRAARGMSAAELGEAAGFARGYVWRAENGKLNCNATTLARFAGSLGVTLAEFFDGIQVDHRSISKRPFAWRNPQGVDERPKRRSGGDDAPDG